MGRYLKVVPGRAINTSQAFDEVYLVNDDGTPWTPDNPAFLDAVYSRTLSNTAVLFGSSLEAQGDIGSDSLNPGNQNGAVNGRGWFNWVKAYSGQRLDLVYNAGISGNNTTNMAARVQADVVAKGSGWVFIGGPANDAPSGIGAATTIANLTAIYTALRGKRIVQLNTAPREVHATTQIRKDVSDVNDWLTSVHTLFPNVAVVDVWRLLATPSTGLMAAGMAVDGTHYTEAAAAIIGKAVWDRIAPTVLPRPRLGPGLLDPRNCIGNPDFSGGAGWTSLVAANTTITYPQDDDTWGGSARIVVAGNTDNAERGVRYVEPVASGRYAPGDVIQLAARIRWSGLTPYTTAPYFSHPHLRMRMRLADSSYAVDTYGMFVPSNAYATASRVPASGDVVLKTPKFTVPANTANLYIDAGWMGLTDGVITVSELAVSKII